MRIVAITMCLLAAASQLAAQDHPLADASLPRGVAARLNSIIDKPTTHRINGAGSVSDTIATDVVVTTGPLTLSGRIGGNLIVIDGDVEFREGASVAGDVTVVGGEAIALEKARIDGTITMYSEGFRLFERDKLLSVDHRSGRIYNDWDHRDWGHTNFALRTSWNYNRVEGLPIEFGPIVETGGRNPTRIEGLAIWRTELGGPFDTGDWGYSIRAEQFLGGRRDFRIGGALRSVVTPIESWQLTRSEASLATAILHEDLNDYFSREGWSVYARFAPRATGLSAQLQYSDEDHASERARSPWTLFDNGDPWRLQPLVGEGRFRSVTGTLQLDRRNDDDYATDGFLLRAEATRGVGGSLTAPISSAPQRFSTQFTNALVDARVYREVGHHGALALRFVGAGSLGNEALPPQFQHALGGAGALPGYALFTADCGARSQSVTSSANNALFYPEYGCDRVAMFSAEYRGGFDIHFGSFEMWDDEDGERHGWNFDGHPNWVLFFDGGRGWAVPDSKARGARDTDNLADVGAGLLLGDFALYGAVPLTGTARSMRFFVRLGARF